jgi:hypothetical protein
MVTHGVGVGDQHLSGASAGGPVARSKTREAGSHTSTSAFSHGLGFRDRFLADERSCAAVRRVSTLGEVLFVELGWSTRGDTLSMLNDEQEGWRDRGVRSNGMAAGAGDRIVDFDVSWLVPADLDAVDALARLQVAAFRSGWWLQFHGANGGLVELVELVGLSEFMHLCPHCRPA